MIGCEILYKLCQTIGLGLGAGGAIMLAFALKEEINAERKFLEELGPLPKEIGPLTKIAYTKWFHPGLILFISGAIITGFLIWLT